MQLADLVRMLVLAAIWGASFPLMRMSVADFGALPIAMIRVVGGSLFLAPLLIYRKELLAAKDKWRQIACVGIFNSAIPFFCFSFAASVIAAGLASVFNATTPLWGALIARIWLGDRLSRLQVIGLAIGFTGVLYLAWDTAHFKEGASASKSLLAVVACLTATACYGFSGSYTKRYLKGVPPLATATGSLIAAGAILVIPAAGSWPTQTPSLTSWWCVIILAVGCTGVAFVVFYRLLANAGPTIALAVAYMIPVFANLWSWLLLNEPPTQSIVVGCCMILTGTTLATGIIKAQSSPAEK
jgi:drug/metabolite transporter (DMT)-like permease